jgi:hypothetical protein
MHAPCIRSFHGKRARKLLWKNGICRPLVRQKLHELCDILHIVFMTTLTQELPAKSFSKKGHLVPAYAMAALPGKEKFLTPLVENRHEA